MDHIDKYHGANGIHDHSMEEDKYYGKIPYVIQNYTNIDLGDTSGEYRDKDHKHSKTVVLSMQTSDGIFHVVEAVPDSKIKALHIVTSYRSGYAKDIKRDAFSELSDVPKNPSSNAQDVKRSDASSNKKIALDAEKVNEENV